MGGRFRSIAVLLVVALSFTVTGCSGGGRPGIDTVETGDDAGMIQRFDPADRKQVEDFSGTLLDGTEFTSSELDGSVVVVNVWGSWCAPCRSEAPVLRQVATQFADQGVRFLGLNVRDNDGAALAFERRFEIPYPSINSVDSPVASLAFANLLTTAAVPMTVVVDRNGLIAARVVGETSEPTLRGLVEDVLAEG